tara:strand:- start:3530 stop:4501 length:972 start_codon:yes stop_codon:yes gene_type:complete
MSLYGYADALSQGTAFNARVKNFNDGVILHNEEARKEFKEKVQQKQNDIADDKRREEEDSAIYGFKDGTGFISTGLGLVKGGAGIREHGLMGYASKEISDRAKNIKSTAKAIVYGEPQPKSTTLEVGEVGEDGRINLFEDAEQAGANAAEAGEVAGDVASATERESSGLMTAAIKKGLKVASVGKIGDAGLSAISEIGGKAIGDFSGALDVGKNIKNLVNGSNIFAGESTADKFQEAGAIADVAGIAFPPLEVVGGALNLTGGIIDAVNDISDDMDKKDDDTKRQVPEAKITSVKVSPAFQSMGLVASQLPSAKTQITGTGSF